jgi:excisionase family DNA binding protein
MGKRRPFVGDRLIKSAQLPAIRVGKNYRIRESDVDRYLSERSV